MSDANEFEQLSFFLGRVETDVAHGSVTPSMSLGIEDVLMQTPRFLVLVVAGVPEVDATASRK